ncbi:hypothetical protein T4A_6167 [Trichinella pseudospiralis]|uniref:Uncharacterized protein n=1 Tax=Trichinella pseudospiralis TaxID=6337 RepID=A0A0V1DVU0_TRIPS|nr:hypothetical protein T4A_6167 [Trichinella pseudospiralis]
MFYIYRYFIVELYIGRPESNYILSALFFYFSENNPTYLVVLRKMNDEMALCIRSWKRTSRGTKLITNARKLNLLLIHLYTIKAFSEQKL